MEEIAYIVPDYLFKGTLIMLRLAFSLMMNNE